MMRSHLLVYVPAACALAFPMAACGSTGAPSGTVTNAGSPAPSGPSPALQFARCMRANGVPSFPDPGTGPGPQTSLADPRSPAFLTAQNACKKYLPNDGQPHAMSEAERQKAVAFAKCMRTHGEPGFPDPTLGAPSGSTPVLALRGMTFQFPSGLNPVAPAFRQAASKCGLHLVARKVIP